MKVCSPEKVHFSSPVDEDKSVRKEPPPAPKKTRPERVSRCLFPRTESDIGGDGYGSWHVWRKEETAAVGAAPPEVKWTRYRCTDCGEIFYHRYALTPDVFEAMKKEGVNSICL